MDDKNLVSVLIFYPFSPERKNGIQRFTTELINSLKPQDLKVYTLYWYRESGLFNSFCNLVRSFLFSLKMVDTVHFVVLSPYNIPFILVARILKKRIVITYHGNYIAETPLRTKPQFYIPFYISDKLSRKFSDIIISPSNYLLKELSIEPKKSVVISNPCASNRNGKTKNMDRSAHSNISIVAATNFNIEQKATSLNVMLEAFRENLSKCNLIKVYIFGEGKFLPLFRKIYAGIENLEFMGFREDFKEYLINADLYAHISGLDNQPYAVLDALLASKVILFNKNEGISEMLNEENNFTVSLSKDSISNSLDTIIQEIEHDFSNFVNKGEMNKRFSEQKHDPSIISSKYLQIYKCARICQNHQT